MFRSTPRKRSIGYSSEADEGRRNIILVFWFSFFFFLSVAVSHLSLSLSYSLLYTIPLCKHAAFSCSLSFSKPLMSLSVRDFSLNSLISKWRKAKIFSLPFLPFTCNQSKLVFSRKKESSQTVELTFSSLAQKLECLPQSFN